MSNLNEETVKSVHHWTDNLFTFTTTRDPGFRFLNGQFVMIGLMVEGKPLLRAYSLPAPTMRRPPVLLHQGAERPPHLPPPAPEARDKILVGRKATGTLIQDNLTPGKRLYLLSPPNGPRPVLVRGEGSGRLRALRADHPHPRLPHGGGTRLRRFPHQGPAERRIYREQVREKLIYYPTVTREPFRNQGRITALIESGKLFTDIGVPVLNPAEDRLMLCGSPQMLKMWWSSSKRAASTRAASRARRNT